MYAGRNHLYNALRSLYGQKVVGVGGFDSAPLQALLSVREADYVVDGFHIK